MTSPAATMPEALADVPRERWPRHIAIIMDGNGRWAQRQNLPRIEGHRRGVASVRRTTEECARLKIEQLTLYCLSSENWKRPQPEIDFLMHLLEQYMIEERTTIMDNNLRVRMIGRRAGIPDQVLRELDKTVDDERHQHAACGSTWRSTTAAAPSWSTPCRRSAARSPRAGWRPTTSTKRRSPSRLYTAGLDDPDLLVRTAGELRISNFLLWQISYAEIWVTDRCWPEFDEPTLHEAIRDFASRNRKYGGLNAVMS